MHLQPFEAHIGSAYSVRQRVLERQRVSSARCARRLPWRGARGSGCVPVSCRHPVKNVTAGKEMAAPGHHGPLFSTEIEHKLHPGSHDGSPNVRFQNHFLGAVASEKINKEYVCKYKYIQKWQNVSDRAVNDNTVGSHVKCVFYPFGRQWPLSLLTFLCRPSPVHNSRAWVFVCVLLLYKNMPSRGTLFSLSHKTTSFSRLWNHSQWNISNSALSVFDKSLLWEMLGKQTEDKLQWATASELKEKNVSTTFG